MKKLFYISAFVSTKIFAVTTLIVSNSNPSGAGSLSQAISDINAGGDTEFNVEFTTNPITLTGSLPLLNLSGATPLTSTVHFNPDGGAHVSGLTLDGGGAQSLFYLAGGTITMNDMIVTGGYAKGGDGLVGGGGALGAGGAIFVATGASFQGTNVQFTSNQAIGGNGGNGNTGTRSGGSGGGMLQGNGGGTMNSLSGGGGGGIQAVGTDSSAASGAAGGGPAGGAGGTAVPAGPGGPGGYASGGGGAGSFIFNLSDGNGANGGIGGYGGGGGGGSVGALGGDGGAGGFGGGGGSAAGGGSLLSPPPADSGGNGGAAGFGGGGGGGGAGFGGGRGLGGAAGDSTYGGGEGGHGSTAPTQSNGGGGGGSALGGAIFVDTGASFSLFNSTTFTGNSSTFGTGGAAGGDDATGGSNGVAFGSDLFLNSNTTANFTTTSASNLAGSIAGFGSILKTGAATLTIADISDSNISRITVEQGILSTPGSVTPGSMSFQLTSDHTNFGQLEVGGTANISATDLLLNFSPGSYSGEYGILTAGTLNGTFASVTPSPLGFSYTLVYRGNDVFIVFGTSALGINTEGLKGNALAIANYLNTLDSNTYASIVQSLNSLSLSERKQALDAMSPSTNSFGPFAAQNTLFLFQETINLRQGNQRVWNRLGRNLHSEELVAQNEEITTIPEDEYAKEEEKPFAPIGKMRGDAKYSFWASGIGQFASQRALHQNPGFHVTSGGGLVGFDYGNPERGLVGCAAGFANSYVKENDHLGHISVDQYLAVLYGNVYWDPFYLELALWNGIDTFENKRNIRFTGFDESAKSSHLDYQLSPHLGFGADWFVGPLGIEPFCNIDWPINFENDFSESGAGLLNMKQRSQNDSMLRVEPGLRLYERVLSTNWVFLFREKLSYVYKKPFNGGDRITANIVGAPGSFVVTWMTSAQNLFSTSFELFGKSNNNRYFSVLYDGEFGSGYISNQVTARFGIYF